MAKFQSWNFLGFGRRISNSISSSALTPVETLVCLFTVFVVNMLGSVVRALKNSTRASLTGKSSAREGTHRSGRCRSFVTVQPTNPEEMKSVKRKIGLGVAAIVVRGHKPWNCGGNGYSVFLVLNGCRTGLHTYDLILTLDFCHLNTIGRRCCVLCGQWKR